MSQISRSIKEHVGSYVFICLIMLVSVGSLGLKAFHIQAIDSSITINYPSRSDVVNSLDEPRRDNDIQFTNLSLDQGLSQSVVTAIWQDRSGFMWFGTQDGLNRYDGYNFKIFKNNPTDPHSLSDNYIYSIVEDDQGYIWIGTNRGLNKYDPLSEGFEHYFHDSQNPSSLSDDAITELYIDRGGFLWVGTVGGGLNRFDGMSFLSYRNDPEDTTSISNDTISAIYEDSRKNFWIGTIEGGLNQLDRTSGKFIRYYNDPDDSTSLADNTVYSVVEDKQGNLWIATSNGLAKLEFQTGRFSIYRHEANNKNSISDNVVYVVFLDQDGELWAGTNTGGLNRYYSQTGIFTHYYPVYGASSSLPAAGVYSIYQDRGGVMWFGTFGGGVAKYSWTREKFPVYRSIKDEPNSLNDNAIWSFLKDRQNVMWFGTVSGGLNRYDETTGEFRHYLHDPNDENSISNNFVMSLFEDSKDQFWVGTIGGGLNQMDRETGRFKHYDTPPNITDIAEDSRGNLLIGTNVGLGRFIPEEEIFTYYVNDPDNQSSLSDNGITIIYEDHIGRIWIGTFSGGLNLFNIGMETFTRYRYESGNNSSLSSDTVLSILEDYKGNLWIGTTSGLEQFNPESGKFTHYREQDGLPNNVIYGIVEDDQHYLWLSTNRGITKFNPQTKIFRNYTPADGLQSNEFNQNAYYKDVQGWIYFGGINGYNAFKPELILDNPYIPPIEVIDFNLFNESIKPGDDSPLMLPITEVGEINLNYRQDYITFEFAALDYSAPERNIYEYKMERLDRDWNKVGTRNIAIYTNVPPGKYIFRVRGANSDGVWNDTGASINIVITPPFWQTWWFRGLAVTLLIGAIVGIFSIRLQIIESQKKRLEIIVAERTHKLNETMLELKQSRDAAQAANKAKSIFLANISHELRTPLNAILGFSRLMLNSSSSKSNIDEKLSSTQRDNLEIINRSGEHLLGLINDVLEMSKIEAGRLTVNEHNFDLYHMLNGLEDMFRLRAEDKGLVLEFSLEPDVPKYINTDEGKLRQILMNLLSNAVKFTDAGGIEVRVRIQEGKNVQNNDVVSMLFEVEDSGPGIPQQDYEAIFEPFVQSTSGRQAQEGTGLGLSISQQYAHLIGGDLTLRSEIGRGSVFTLVLPVILIEEGKIHDTIFRRKVIGLEADQPVYRLLVVDDKEVNRQLIVRMLTPLGFEVREAQNGKVALELWNSWSPHLIWMDMRMPVMDGYEATRRIKETVKGQATVIVALTASALEEDRQIILSEGCDDYIRKPFRDEEIYRALEKHLGVRFIYEENTDLSEEESGLVGSLMNMDNQVELIKRLREIPIELVDELWHATNLGAVESIKVTISQIHEFDIALADLLDEWAENYEHEKILALIEAERSEKDTDE